MQFRVSPSQPWACDLAFVHTLNSETSLITLKVDKNRHGPRRTFTIRADFEEGKFDVTNSPYVTQRNDELARLEAVIQSSPGITQNALWKQSGMAKARCLKALNEGAGTRWKTEKGKKANMAQFAIFPVLGLVLVTLSLCSQRTEQQEQGLPSPH